MNGKQHRQVAPIFTAGATIILNSLGVISREQLPLYLFLSCISSITTANLADADNYVDMPTKVVLNKQSKKNGGKYKGSEDNIIKIIRRVMKRNHGFLNPFDLRREIRKSKNYRHIVRYKDGRVKEYYAPKNKLVALFAILFKIIGVDKHRDWRTHSPLVHIPLGLLLLFVSFKINFPLFSGIINGFVFGYWSHIFADLPNKGGIQLRPKGPMVSLTRNTIFSDLFRSGTKFSVSFVYVLIIEIVLFVVNKDLAISLNRKIGIVIIKLVTMLVGIIKSIFEMIFGMIS